MDSKFSSLEVSIEELTEEERITANNLQGKVLRIYSWPSNNVFHNRRYRSQDRGLQVLAHCARIATVAVDVPYSEPDDELLSTTLKKPRSSLHPDTEQRFAKTKQSAGHQNLFIKAYDGQGLFPVRKIDLHSYFTDAEIEELNENYVDYGPTI